MVPDWGELELFVVTDIVILPGDDSEQDDDGAQAIISHVAPDCTFAVQAVPPTSLTVKGGAVDAPAAKRNVFWLIETGTVSMPSCVIETVCAGPPDGVTVSVAV
jgi:hypothetical protein